MAYKVGDKVIYRPATDSYSFYDEFTVTRVGRTADVARQVFKEHNTGEWKRVPFCRLYPHSEDLMAELRRHQSIKSDHLRAINEINDTITGMLDAARKVVKSNA